MPSSKKKKFVGTFIDTPILGEVRILHDHALEVSSEGFITSFGPYDLQISDSSETVHIPKGSFLLPTFVDLHLHAPQYLYQGTGLHLPLMTWLDSYAYKAEERLDADPVLAKRVYEALANRLLENGTGTVLLFGTIKTETNMILVEVMQAAGIRAFVGKLSMDISSRPSYVEPSAPEALSAVRDFISAVRKEQSKYPSHMQLVKPVITPRFVPTCSDELLSGLGKLSEELDVHIQSHLAEARDQVDWVRQTRGEEDIDVFDRHGLLTPRTIQAHCTYLTQSDLSRLSLRGTGIAHCPLSNAYFSGKPFPLREVLTATVNVGLGTDVAGGYSADLGNSMRQSVMVSRMREGSRSEGEGQNPKHNVSINWMEALYLATKSGANVLRLPPGSGTFTVGAPFDAQLIELYSEPSTTVRSRLTAIGAMDVFDPPSKDEPVTFELLEKWWCIGDTRNRRRAWIQGRQVYTT